MATAKRGIQFVPEGDPAERRYTKVSGIELFMTPGEASALLRMADLVSDGHLGRGLAADADHIADALTAVVLKKETETLEEESDEPA